MAAVHSLAAPRDLPYEEFDLLRNAIDTAAVQAATGRCSDGYSELSYGLRRAEMMLGDGIPWADELVKHYRAALREYCARFDFART